MDAEEGPVSLLQAQVPSIVKALHRQMKEKSIKTRQGRDGRNFQFSIFFHVRVLFSPDRADTRVAWRSGHPHDAAYTWHTVQLGE